MRYRRLDAQGDYTFGHGQSDFFRDVPDAPAQAALTRLMLWQGEWFLDLREGTPWRTQVLGKYTGSTRDPALRARIAGARGVSRIASYASQVNHETRAYSVQATVDTIYGGIPIAIPAVLIPPQFAKATAMLTPLRGQSGAAILSQSGQQLYGQR